MQPPRYSSSAANERTGDGRRAVRRRLPSPRRDRKRAPAVERDSVADADAAAATDDNNAELLEDGEVRDEDLPTATSSTFLDDDEFDLEYESDSEDIEKEL